jgi:outer membrane receptor for ferrienterochelin and colicins
MKKFYLAFFFLISTILQLSAQELTGIVRDAENGETLIMVNVLAAQRRGTVTNSEGRFNLILPAGESTVQFSYVGYEPKSITVVLEEGETQDVEITLMPRNEVLDPVVVSAGKYEQRIEQTTVSLEVIKPNLIKEKNTVRMEDAFNQVPGVVINDNQVNIRSGSGWSFGAGSRVLMLVDDMPLLSPDAGQIQWLLLPNEAVMQMEVIKAASSVLYGTSAMNGLINVRTITPKTEPLTEVMLFGGTWDSPKRKELKWWDGVHGHGGFTFLHSRKVGSADITLSGLFSRDQGFRYREDENLNRINLKTQFYPTGLKGLTWGVNGSVLYSETGDALIWYDLDNAYIPRDSATTRSNGWDYLIDPFVTYRYGKNKHTLRGRYMGLNNNARNEDVNYENYSTYYYGEYQFQHFFTNDFWVTAGAVGALAYSDSEVFMGYHESANWALFAQADKTFDRFTVSGGLRYEHFRLDDRIFSKPVFRVGGTYQAGKATFLRASIGQGFRFPSMSETFSFTEVGSTGVYPNLELQPEDGWTAEIGVKQGVLIGKGWKGFIDLSGFINYFNNMTEFTFGDWSDLGYGLGFRSLNVGNTRILGTELTFSGMGKIGQANVRLLSGYTFTLPQALEPDKVYATYGGFEANYRTTSSDPTNDILKYRYQHLLRFDINVDYKKFGLGVSTRYNDFMQNIDEILNLVFIGVEESREVLSDGDIVIDARLYYQFNPQWRVSFIVDNANNREYSPRPAQLGAPRRFTLQVLYTN